MNKSNSKPGSSRKPTTQKRNRGERSKYVTKRSMHGGRMIPSNDPPQLAFQPWNHITLAWYQKPADVNFGDLVNKIKSQLDPNETGFHPEKLAIQMKIHSIRVWNISGKHIALTVYDYIDGDNDDQLCGDMDAGSNTGIPRLGYELPITFRQHVVRNDSKTGKNVLFTVSSATNDMILHYVRMEWRFDGPVKAPSIDLDWQRRSYEIQRDNLNTNVRAADAIVKILDAQPSLVQRVIDNVIHHAAEIALVADDKRVLTDLADSLRVLTFDTCRDSTSK